MSEALSSETPMDQKTPIGETVSQTKKQEVIVSLHTTQAVKIRCLFETLTPLLVEGTLLFDEKGMTIKGSNVISFAEIQIKQSKNTEISRYVYRSEKDRIVVGVSFEIVHACLSAIGPHDSMRFELTRKGLDAMRPYLSIYVYNNDLQYEYRSDVYLLMIEHNEIESPMKRFAKVVSIPSSLFLKVLRFSQKRGEAIQIFTRNLAVEVDGKEKKNQYICFRTVGDEAELMFKQKFSGVGEVEVLKKELYSLKYLLLISKATNLSSTVEIYLQTDDILALKYRIGTVGSAIFAIAPQVETAEDVPNLTPEPKIESKDKEKPTVSKFKRPVKRKKRATVTQTLL